MDPEFLPASTFLERAYAQGWLDPPLEVSKQEARRITESSDGFLLIQPQTAVQVPGKVFQYLTTGHPILAFLQRGSPTERIFERSGVPHRCVYPGSSDAAIDDAVAAFFDLPSRAVQPSPWFEQQFDAARQTEDLDRAISSLHSGIRMATKPHDVAESPEPKS